MVHGNLQVSSIFTNKAGEWKLGGFELLCSMKEESPIILVEKKNYFEPMLLTNVITDFWRFNA